MKLSYLPQEKIDKQRWDRCIETASNGLIYGYSFYLDTLSKNWDALISDDYSWVMPLTWNKKFGFYYLYQPFFAASLGLFGNNISPEIVKQFLAHIPPKFKYWDFYLNRSNMFAIDGYDLYERRNYILDLSPGYEILKSNYSKSHVRNIARAIKAGNIVKKNIPLKDVIELAKEQSKNFSPITENDYENFSKLFSILSAKESAVTYGVYSSQGQLTASCAYFLSHNRAYYILVGNHPNGRTSGASHLLIDYFIKEHAGEKIILDFEGSDLKNLAWFYSSFGAVEEKYPGIRLNKLPAVAKLFKQ